MRPSIFKIVITISVVFFLLSCILFSWQLMGGLTPKRAIYSGRFADFGDFIAGIFGAINFILLLYAFQETKKQSYDTFFFNSLQIHDSIVKDLKSNKGDLSTLNNEGKAHFDNYLCENLGDDGLKTECINYRNMPASSDYFETLYQILHIRYKYKNEPLQHFFNDYNWRIGHYLRSLLSLVELIDETITDNAKKRAYIRVLQSRSSNDEIRLLFYFILSSGNSKIAGLFRSCNFFGVVANTFILSGDQGLFNNLVKA